MNEVHENNTENKTEGDVNETRTAPTEVSQPKKKGNNMRIIAVFLAIVIAFFGVAYALGYISLPGNTNDNTVAMNDNNDVVATVNGIEITRAELNKRLEQVRTNIPQGADDPTQSIDFQRKLLDEVINLKLLVNVAKEKGYTVTDEDVNKEINTVKERFGGEEVFAQRLAEAGLTEDEFRENVRNEILIRRLLDDETEIKNIEVTDEEVKKTYDLVAQSNPEGIPPFDQIEGAIFADITQRKSAAIIDAYIAEVRQGADIVVNI